MINFIHHIPNRLERGYEICFQMYEKCHTLAGFNDQYYITLTRPFINKKTILRCVFK